MRTIGQNIRRLRTDAGMSQAKLGELLGKTSSAVSYYESDTIIPRMGVIEDLARIFNVSKTEIIETTPRMTDALTAKEMELVDIMRAITPEGQMQLMVYARGVAVTYSKNNQAAQAV